MEKGGTLINRLEDKKVGVEEDSEDLWVVIDRLYVSRKEGGRGFASIENSVDASKRGLH